MEYAKDQIVVDAARSSNYNMAINLVLISTAKWYLTTDNSSFVQTYVTPSYVYYKSNYMIALGTGGDPVCAASVVLSYDRTTATFLAQYNYASYNAFCAHFSTSIFDIDQTFAVQQGSSVSLIFFGRAFVLSFAVNVGFLEIDELQTVVFRGVLSGKYSYAGVNYIVENRFASRFPGMNPLVCLLYQETGQEFLCMITVGNTLALPVTNHLGNSVAYPQYCNW